MPFFDVGPSPYDLNFRLLGIPVRVHYSFWIAAVFLGIDLPDIKVLLAWILALLVGILVHELGHALMMRAAGSRPFIVLYAFGGVTATSPFDSLFVTRNPDVHIHISAAGPMAGFLLAAIVALFLELFGQGVQVNWIIGFIPFISPNPAPWMSPFLFAFFHFLLVIAVFWGIVNLMPVYPLDGGQIARDVLIQLDPVRGLEKSLVLSLVMAIAIAVFGWIVLHSMFIALLFGFLAYNNYMQLTMYRGF